MKTLFIAFVCYTFTAIFSFAVAGLIWILGKWIKRLDLDRSEHVDVSVPCSNSLKEEEQIATAIAVAYRMAHTPPHK